MCVTYTKEVRDIVTNLEDSKELKKKYPDYPTRFVWHVMGEYSSGMNVSIRFRDKVNEWGDITLYPAFTADELIDLIKQKLDMFDELPFVIRGNSHDSLVDDIVHQFFIKGEVKS